MTASVDEFMGREASQESVASGSNADPKRPIPVREPLVPAADCPHPWSRIAFTEADEGQTLQCFDCATFVLKNGRKVVIPWK